MDGRGTVNTADGGARESARYDVIVVGAGPAGTAFARMVAGSRKVLVLERPTRAGKCCGGLIAPDAQKMLASLDVGIPKRLVADPQLFYVRAYDLRLGEYRSYQRHYTNVDRAAFDDYMIAGLPAGVELMRDALYLGHSDGGDGVTVVVESGGRRLELRCSLLVGADGARSRVREALFGDSARVRRYLAIQAEYDYRGGVNHFGVFFDSRLTDFYSWLIPKDARLLVGGAFDPRRDPRRRFAELVEAVRALGYGLGERKALSAAFIVRPRLRDVRIGRGRVALIGEAAGFISPSSSEGLSYAYRSASALARAVVDSPRAWARGYARRSLSLRLNILAKSAKGFFMYNGFARALIFKTGLGSIR